MYCLGVETSTVTGSIALFNHSTIVDSASWSRQGSHSEFLSHNLKVMLQKNSLKLNDLHRIAVGVGPGSFTGVRVAINFARTLSYALKLPVYNLNSLALLASQLTQSKYKSVLVAQFAFRDLLYVAQYDLDQGLAHEKLAPHAMTISECIKLIQNKTIIVGSGRELLLKSMPQEIVDHVVTDLSFSDSPSASFFSYTPAVKESFTYLYDWINTIPLYIRASEAEEKLKTGLIKPV